MNLFPSVRVVTIHLLTATLFALYWVRTYQQDKSNLTMVIAAIILVNAVLLIKHWVALLKNEPFKPVTGVHAASVRAQVLSDSLYNSFPYFIPAFPTAKHLESSADFQYKVEAQSKSLSTNISVLQIALGSSNVTAIYVFAAILGLISQNLPNPPSYLAFLTHYPPLLALIDTIIAALVSSVIAMLGLRYCDE